jgi:hypothetical protein
LGNVEKDMQIAQAEGAVSKNKAKLLVGKGQGLVGNFRGLVGNFPTR